MTSAAVEEELALEMRGLVLSERVRFEVEAMRGPTSTSESSDGNLNYAEIQQFSNRIYFAYKFPREHETWAREVGRDRPEEMRGKTTIETHTRLGAIRRPPFGVRAVLSHLRWMTSEEEGGGGVREGRGSLRVKGS